MDKFELRRKLIEEKNFLITIKENGEQYYYDVADTHSDAIMQLLKEKYPNSYKTVSENIDLQEFVPLNIDGNVSSNNSFPIKLNLS